MERNEFDKILRDRLEGVTEAAPDVWEGISQGLARRHRRILLRRFATGAVAAAAGLAVALLVFRGPKDGKQPEAPVRIAQSVQPQEVTPTAPSGEIAPIAEQIASFTKNQVTAQAAVTKPAIPAGTVKEEVPAEVTPVVEEPVVEEPTVEEPVAVLPPEQASDNRPMLTENDLPDGFWNESEENRSRDTHTSRITILSNLTTVASDNDLIYRASPSHASSQGGKGQASSAVEPVSLTNAPKFFSPLSFGLQFETALSGRLSVATGLTYTYLVSQYDMLVNKEHFTGAYNQLHYVGVPLALSYHLVQTPSFGFYASAGGAVEKCVSQRYVYGSNTLHEKVGGVQWSTKVGLGAEYWFIPRLGLYFDPSLVYYFDNSQPFSIRTQQPLQARFEVGLRFKL